MRLPSVPGLGLGTTDHVLPFQCSVRVWPGVNCPFEYSPATQTSLPAPVAPQRRLVLVPTLGLVTCDHALPFQCSVSVLPGPPGGTPSGCTARHEFQCRVGVRPGWSAVLVNIPPSQTSVPLPVAPKR